MPREPADVRTGRGVVEVTEVTRGGVPVRTARSMANRALGLVDHPAESGPAPDYRAWLMQRLSPPSKKPASAWS